MCVSCDVLTRSEAFSHSTAFTSDEVDANFETPNLNFTNLPCTTSRKSYFSSHNWLDIADIPYVHYGITTALNNLSNDSNDILLSVI